MATLGGKHIQARTGRELTHSCAFSVDAETELSCVAVVNGGLALVGQNEDTLRFDPNGIPAASIVRMNLLRQLDQASFGAGSLPDPRWIGRYGPYDGNKQSPSGLSSLSA